MTSRELRVPFHARRGLVATEWVRGIARRIAPVKFLRGLNELRCDAIVVGNQPTIAGRLETLRAELLSWYNRIGDLA